MEPEAASEGEPEPVEKQEPVVDRGLPQTPKAESAPAPKGAKVRGRKTRPVRGILFR